MSAPSSSGRNSKATTKPAPTRLPAGGMPDNDHTQALNSPEIISSWLSDDFEESAIRLVQASAQRQQLKPAFGNLPLRSRASSAVAKPQGASSTTSSALTEFPFPPQAAPKTRVSANKGKQQGLALSIPRNNGEVEDDFRSRTDSIHPSGLPIDIKPSHTIGQTPCPAAPLPVSPRSHPANPAMFSESPPSSSYIATPSSQLTMDRPISADSTASSYFSTMTTPVSPLPSLTTTDTEPSSYFGSTSSAATVPTPLTPATTSGDATQSLREILLAHDLGVGVEKVKDWSDFTNLSLQESARGGRDSTAVGDERMTRMDPKRSGRILVRRPIRQRRSHRSSKATPGGISANTRLDNGDKWGNVSGSLSHGVKEDRDIRRLSRGLDAPTEWREINWSRFSDSSSSTCSNPRTTGADETASYDEISDGHRRPEGGEREGDREIGITADFTRSLPRRTSSRGCADYSIGPYGWKWPT